MSQKDKKDELSTTSAVPSVNTPVGVGAKGRRDRDDEPVEVWHDQEVKEMVENIRENIKKLTEVSPNDYENQDSFMSACVSKLKGEGKSADKAVEMCNGMWYGSKE